MDVRFLISFQDRKCRSHSLSETDIFKNIFRFYDITAAPDVGLESATRHGHPSSPVQPIRCLCTGHNLFLYRKHSLNRMYTLLNIGIVSNETNTDVRMYNLFIR